MAYMSNKNKKGGHGQARVSKMHDGQGNRVFILLIVIYTTYGLLILSLKIANQIYPCILSLENNPWSELPITYFLSFPSLVSFQFAPWLGRDYASSQFGKLVKNELKNLDQL